MSCAGQPSYSTDGALGVYENNGVVYVGTEGFLYFVITHLGLTFRHHHFSCLLA